MNIAAKTGLDALNAGSKNGVHKATEVTVEFTGTKIAVKIVKPKLVLDENSRNVE